MKKYLTIIAFSVMAILCQAQNFSKNYAVYDFIDSGTKVVPYSSGFIVQFFGNKSINDIEHFLGLIETNTKGELQNKVIFDSLVAYPLILEEDNKIVFGASLNYGTQVLKKMFLIQSDLSGTILKQKNLENQDGFHFSRDLQKLNSNYYYSDQISYYGDNFNNHVWTMDSIKILNFDTSFHFKKTILCPYIVPIIYTFSTVVQDKNFLVCALSEQDTSSGDMKHVVIAFDSTGNKKWQYTEEKNIIPLQKPAINAVGLNNNSTVILIPYITDSFSIPEQRLLKLDDKGKKIWTYDDMSILKEGTQEFYSLFKTKGDDFVVVGQQNFVQINDNRRTGVIMRVDNNGKLKWKRRVWDLNTPFGQSGFNGGIELEDGSLLITGWWRDTIGEPNYYDTNVWLIKLDSNGCFNPGCTGDDIVASQQNIIVLSKDLLKISPNPAHNQIQCSWSNTPSEAKYICVFDMNGVEIIKQDVTAKDGNISIDISRVPSGVYLVKLFGDKWESGPEKIVKE